MVASVVLRIIYLEFGRVLSCLNFFGLPKAAIVDTKQYKSVSLRMLTFVVVTLLDCG